VSTGTQGVEAGRTPFELVGGPEAVRALAMRFYDEMEAHEPALTAIHRLDAPGRVSAASREAFAMFLAFWLGGPQDYLQTHGHPRLRMRHGHVPVDAAMRDAWLRSMTRAMDALGIAGEVRTFLDKRFADVADFLRNVPEAS
jgi:hemoglobin